MSGRVLVIGDAMLDVVVRPDGPIARSSDTPARVRVGRGGSGANLAAALRAASDDSLEVVFAGIVGDDVAALIVRADLERSGLVAYLATAPGTTGVVVSLVAPSGERAMLTDRGVNGELRFEHVASLLDSSLVHLHVSGYTALDERTRALAREVLSAGALVGASTSIDVCSVEPLERVGATTFHAVARGATMLFANEEEALVLTGEHDTDAALDALSRQWREVLVTRGSRGAVVRRDDVTYRASAIGEDVVDTTGAGDSATGAYLGHRLAGADVTTSLDFAMAAAARVVRGLGSRG